MKLFDKEQIDTTLPNNDMSGIKLRDCKWQVKTAGPSPFDNNRTELFLLGCKKAMSGKPCEGCFNSSTWDDSKAIFSHDPILMAKHINNNAPNKYITIGGGEPTDQIDNLIILCKELKKYNFNIMIYTWKSLINVLKDYTFAVHFKDKITHEIINNEEKHKFIELLKYVDIVVDGEYKQEERLWDGTKEDGLISSVGSGNQIIWDINNKRGFNMKDIDSILMNNDNTLLFNLKNSKVHNFELNI